jgi:NitT/TauT family transport system ATP-binding protein
MSSAPLVRLEQVGKRFGEGPAVLSGIDLTVERGDFVSFVGPSGCGKSTLLRLIAGLIAPSAGKIAVAGTAPAAARDKMFFVFQDASLLPWRRTAANVELPLLLRGLGPAQRRTRVAQTLALVGLSDAAEKYPWQLSGGMKMRASIARALSVAPEILLLDEPFGSLDELTRDRLNEDLLAIRERDPFTACFVTHSVSEALFLSNRIVVLAPHPGRIAQVVDVPFAYPRSAALRADPAFLKLGAEVAQHLRAVPLAGGSR